MQRLLDNLRFVLQPRRKPLLLTRILRSYAGYLLHRVPESRPLRNIDVALNYACNLACSHCSCEMLKRRDQPPMTEGQYRDLAEQGLDLGCIYFSFTGGEPLLNRNLEDIIRLFHPGSTLIGLQTNAMLLTPERARSLRKAGVDVLQVSFDSADPTEHDAMRQQPGAFAAMMHSLAVARELNFRIILSSTITHSNLRGQGILDMLDFAQRSGSPLVLSVPCPVGRWTGNFTEQLDDDDRVYFNGLRQRFPHLRRDFDSNYFRMGCSAGTEKLYVTPYGDVIPCPFIHVSFGNAIREPLADIRARMLRLNRLREYNQVCLAGEDKDFIDRYVIPTYGQPSLPMPWQDHENLRDVCAPGKPTP